MNWKRKIAQILAVIIFSLFSQCASNQKMDASAPISIKNAYFHKVFQNKIEKGFVMYFPVEADSSIELTYAYFKGKKIKLQQENEKLYIGRHQYPSKDKKLIMHSDPKEEFKNRPPIIEKIPFELKDNECVIEYTKNDKTRHFRIKDVPEKQE